VSQANLTKTERIIDLPSANAPSLVKDPSNATAPWPSLINRDTRVLEPLSGLGAVLKRLEDFVLGSIALMLVFPILVVISIIIKLDSTGPALFCQARSGRNREVIKVYKFRTMYQRALLAGRRSTAFVARRARSVTWWAVSSMIATTSTIGAWRSTSRFW